MVTFFKFFFTLIFIVMGSAFSFALEGPIKAIKIQVSHSHTNSHEHHHHHDNLEENHHLDVQEENQNSKKSEDSDKNEKHSHELLISSSHTFFVEDNIDIQINQISNDHFSESLENNKPQRGYFDSIFRPPIQA